jgi:hypothetical protein
MCSSVGRAVVRVVAMATTDWAEWHEAYARPGSSLNDRLDAVRTQIRRHLDTAAPAPVRVVSACAGDGRDLLGVLSDRSDADRVSALLVEYDARLVERARESARAYGSQIEVHQADASRSDAYADAVPADLVLLCGIFGNITDADVQATIQAAPQLCSAGAEVIWTRHRGEPDLTPAIRGWFKEADFDEVAFVAPDDAEWSVGVHRLAGEPLVLELGQKWFSFFR